jgi:predicted porin
MKKSLFLLCVLSLFASSAAYAEIKGKVEFGPTWINSEMTDSGPKSRNLNVKGFGANGTVAIWKGLCLKPLVNWAEGKSQTYWSTGLGVGFAVPFMEKWLVIPHVGTSYTSLKFRRDLPIPGGNNLDQKMKSRSQYVGSDLSYKITDKLSITGSVQYAWVSTYTTISSPFVPANRAESRGFNYFGMVDYYINDNWSLNLAGAIMKSKTKERYGSDGMGVRVGLGYKFSIPTFG